jgi:A/G-specific adenine glycosylase
MSRIAAVIFDLDGTLINSEPLYEVVDQEFLISKGVRPVEIDWSSVIGMGGRPFLTKIKSQFDLPEDLDSLVAEKDELYLSRANEVEVFAPVVELVRYLYVHGYSLAIATSSRRAVLDRMLSQTGLDLYFSVSVSADDVEHHKPDPEPFLVSAKALSVDPSECVVLEDSRYGVAAARAAGMSTVALPGPSQDREAFESADLIVDGGSARLDPELIIERFGLFPVDDALSLTAEMRTRIQSVVYGHAARNPRPMPWRETHDPYAILVSEFMLQQTQVSRVISKYQEFLERFPSPEMLADSSVGAVLSLWQGLGYNRRGKFLWQAACEIVNQFDGAVPDSIKALESLPGVGNYTASAVMAFAFSRPVVVVETNIRRAMIHLLFPNRQQVEETSVVAAVEAVMDRANPREWYYALMDYGAYLGRVVPNRNRRSAAYSRQSRFEGSLRQVRGRIIRALAGKGPLTVRELESVTGPTDNRFERAIDALLREELIVRDGDLLKLP